MKENGTKKVDETLYRSFVGNLLYLSAIRSDIMFPPSLLSRFINNPSYLSSWCCKESIELYSRYKELWHQI